MSEAGQSQENASTPSVPPQPQQFSAQPQQFAPQPQQFTPQPQQYASQPQQFTPQPQQYAPRPQQYAPQPAPMYSPVNTHPVINQITHQDNTVGIGAFFGLMLVFMIPIIGLITALILSFVPKNRSLRNFSRAALIWCIIGLVILGLIIAGVKALISYITEQIMLLMSDFGDPDELLGMLEGFIGENADLSALIGLIDPENLSEEDLEKILGYAGELSEEDLERILGNAGDISEEDLERILGYVGDAYEGNYDIHIETAPVMTEEEYEEAIRDVYRKSESVEEAERYLAELPARPTK